MFLGSHKINDSLLQLTKKRTLLFLKSMQSIEIYFLILTHVKQATIFVSLTLVWLND
jgi:hypothetical protein